MPEVTEALPLWRFELWGRGGGGWCFFGACALSSFFLFIGSVLADFLKINAVQPFLGVWKTRARVTPRAEEALTPDNFYN